METMEAGPRVVPDDDDGREEHLLRHFINKYKDGTPEGFNASSVTTPMVMVARNAPSPCPGKGSLEKGVTEGGRANMKAL